MCAGAEGQAGIQHDGGAATRVFSIPVGNDDQVLAHLHGGVVVLPAFLPVGFGEGGDIHLQTQFVDSAFQTVQSGGVSVLQIDLDPGQTLEPLLEVLIDVVPVVPVALQEFLEFLLVLDDQVGEALGGEPGHHGADAVGFGINGNFKPCHVITSLSACYFILYCTSTVKK